uniref:Uncharacterized protein n=1 Tax=Salix viminalis TaxID=40686 RepID=A0A6N2KKB1_SALVM
MLSVLSKTLPPRRCFCKLTGYDPLLLTMTRSSRRQPKSIIVPVYGTTPRRWNQDFHAIAVRYVNFLERIANQFCTTNVFQFSFGNLRNISSLNFGSLNLVLSSPITPSSSDLVPPMISFIFPQQSTFISSRFTRQLQEDGTRISMLLQYDTLISWRESQISFALQMLFSSSNPCNLKDLNFGSLNLLLSSSITPSSSDLVPPIISSIFIKSSTSYSSRFTTHPRNRNQSFHAMATKFTGELQEDGTRISMLLQLVASIFFRESQISFELQMLFSFDNPHNISSLNFGSLISELVLLLLSSSIIPSSSDLVPPIISSIFSQSSTLIVSRFTGELQEDGTRISMLLQLVASIFFRESQISFELQMLFSFGNPRNISSLNFGSLISMLLLSSPITSSSSDLVPPIISSTISQCSTSMLSRFTRIRPNHDRILPNHDRRVRLEYLVGHVPDQVMHLNTSTTTIIRSNF